MTQSCLSFPHIPSPKMIDRDTRFQRHFIILLFTLLSTSINKTLSHVCCYLEVSVFVYVADKVLFDLMSLCQRKRHYQPSRAQLRS